MKRLSVMALLTLPVIAAIWAEPPGSVDFSTDLPQRKVQTGSIELIMPSERYTLAPEGDISFSTTQVASRRISKGRRGVSSVSELNGNYVMTCKSLRPDSWGNTGQSADITQIAGTDSILIKNFWSIGINVKAYVDKATGKVDIPNQVVGSMVDNGPIDIAFCLENGKPDRKKKIEGFISDKGVIHFTSWWGIYVVSGTNKDRYAYVAHSTEMERSNAEMSFNFNDGRKVSFGVIVRQNYNNRLEVVNFGNYGMTVNVELDNARGGYIPSQVARQYPANGDFITVAVNEYTETGLKGMSANIPLNVAPAGDNKTLTWGKWTAVSQGKENMYFGQILDGKILCQTDIDYPKAPAGTWQGQGTEADPYRIKTLNDLRLLSDKVNSVPESGFDQTVDGIKCCFAMAGKYFRLENDIDMGGYLFTPIGADVNHRFGGVFDGNNHTISNLHQDVGAKGMAGLIGMTSDKCEVKNLTMVKPVIRAAGLCAATVVSWCYGTVENCHVIEADVYNRARTGAGLVGLGKNVKNCTVKDSYIDAYGGNAAGLAGQVDVNIENCSVTNTTVVAGSQIQGYPSAGVVASMNGASGKNLYFSGRLDANSYMQCPTVGGIAGILSLGTLENSFAVGEIRGGSEDVLKPGSIPVAGGLVGTMSGSKINNCYAVGNVSTYLSRKTGGLTGNVRTYNNGAGKTQEPEIRNCYTVATVKSETYQYQPETEVREALGWVEDGTKLTAENVYYDKQVMNLNSQRFGATTAELTSAQGPKGFDSSVWVFTAGQYPRIKGLDGNDAAHLSASAIVIPDLSSMKKLSADAEVHPLGKTTYRYLVNDSIKNAGRYSSIENGKLRITNDFGTDTLIVENSGVSLRYEIKVAPVPFLGEGTETTPYLISKKSDLIALSYITTEVKQYFPDTYFLMTNDIDMEYDKDFKGIAVDKDAYCKFAGIFDGGGHTVSRIRQDWVVWADPQPGDGEIGTPDDDASMNNGRKGFIGSLAPQGVLRNLNIAKDCKFMFWARSAALVGQNEGLVENCRNYADVTCISTNPAGIVGENRKGTVKNCYNEGHIISGYNCAGGIVGSNAGKIIACVNAGDVEVKYTSSFQPATAKTYRNAGGISGESTGAVYEDCINFGNVYAQSYAAGGISGTLGKVTSTTSVGQNSLVNVISVGMAVTDDPKRLGALAGATGTKGEIRNAYWDGQILPIKAAANSHLAGAEGLNTSELTSGKALDGFSTELWQFDAGQYPVLKQFANEPLVVKARKTVMTMDASSTAKRLRTSATLASHDGLTWKLKEGKQFTIYSGKLNAPVSVTESASDVLYADFGGYAKEIPLVCPIAVPLKGDGTKEKPYLITTADEWNTLSAFADENGEEFQGQFIKIDADIDFNGKEFKPLFCDGVTTLAGTLLGDGHTVKGIKFATTATYNAPIGTVDLPASVSDLTLEGDMTSAFANTGAFTAKVYGKLSNLTNKVNLTSTKASTSAFGYLYAGAELNKVVNKGKISSSTSTLAGIATNTDEGVVLTDVGNEGEINAFGTGTTTYVAGLVANCMPSEFTRCYNKGTFTFAKPESTNAAGGLIGYANSTSGVVKELTLTDCYNTADITAKNYVGGLIGNVVASGSYPNSMHLSGCYNTGEIKSVATTSTTGAGTAGLLALYTPGSVIENCYNTGKVTSNKNTYCGGIAGVQKTAPTEKLPTVFRNCYNTADIVAMGNQGGGVLGTVSAYTTVDSCHNTGNIYGGWGLGGIAGTMLGANSKISACYNLGNVETTVNRAGGIVGYTQYLVSGTSVESELTDCINFGNVRTDMTAGGTTPASSGYAIGGIAGFSPSAFTRCINRGSVKGASQVGGILGYTYPKRTMLKDCINLGVIKAPADTCGSIIGVNLDNAKMWTAENKAENCYYIKPDTELKNNTVGKAATERELAALKMGGGWLKSDDYTFPIPASCAPDTLKVASVIIGFAEGDTEKSVTKDFFVGAPDGLVWTASVPNISFEGPNARFSIAECKGDVTLTACAGDHRRSFVITAAKASGIDGVSSYGEVIGEEYFTTDGLRIAKPDARDGKVYVVVRRYADGKMRAFKVIDR